MAGNMAKVKYNFLGKSGLKVSNICLGTMTFGDIKGGGIQCTEETAHAIMDKYVEYGGNFIDTADGYAKGESECIVGRWLKKQDRKRFVIATKCFNTMDPTDPNSGGLSRKHIMDSVETSLKKLCTDYIDIFQIHKWDDGAPIEETFSTLNYLVASGKIRYIGVSNVSGWQLQKIIDVCKAKGWEDIVSLQQQWSLLCRFPELAEFKVARLEGVGVLPWSPLKGGILSGKYQRGVDLPDGRLRNAVKGSEAYPSVEKLDNETVWNLLDKLSSIAQDKDKSVAQVSLRWLLQQDVVPSVIVGVRTLQQLEDNLGAATGWELTQEQMQILDEASMIDVPYPYNMIARLNISRQH